MPPLVPGSPMTLSPASGFVPLVRFAVPLQIARAALAVVNRPVPVVLAVLSPVAAALVVAGVFVRLILNYIWRPHRQIGASAILDTRQ